MVMEALMLYPFLLVGNSFLVAVIKEGKVDVPVMNSGLFQNVKNWSSIFFFFFMMSWHASRRPSLKAKLQASLATHLWTCQYMKNTSTNLHSSHFSCSILLEYKLSKLASSGCSPSIREEILLLLENKLFLFGEGLSHRSKWLLIMWTSVTHYIKQLFGIVCL